MLNGTTRNLKDFDQDGSQHALCRVLPAVVGTDKEEIVSKGHIPTSVSSRPSLSLIHPPAFVVVQ